MSIENLFKNGYTLIPSLIDEQTCDKLKKYLDKKFNDDLPYNYFKGHYQIHLPDNVEDIPENILFNQKIHDIIGEIFDNYYLSSYTCNANLAEKNQPYHMDCSHLHPTNSIKKFGSPGPPSQVIVNIYLEETDENNGSLDIVPGSHLYTDFYMGENGEIEKKYIKNSIRCNLPKGSVIIRDKRTWHRGTLNTSGKVRYMVGNTYTAGWFKLNNLNFKPDTEHLFYDAPFSTWNLKF